MSDEAHKPKASVMFSYPVQLLEEDDGDGRGLPPRIQRGHHPADTNEAIICFCHRLVASHLFRIFVGPHRADMVLFIRKSALKKNKNARMLATKCFVNFVRFRTALVKTSAFMSFSSTYLISSIVKIVIFLYFVRRALFAQSLESAMTEGAGRESTLGSRSSTTRASWSAHHGSWDVQCVLGTLGRLEASEVKVADKGGALGVPSVSERRKSLPTTLAPTGAAKSVGSCAAAPLTTSGEFADFHATRAKVDALKSSTAPSTSSDQVAVDLDTFDNAFPLSSSAVGKVYTPHVLE